MDNNNLGTPNVPTDNTNSTMNNVNNTNNVINDINNSNTNPYANNQAPYGQSSSNQNTYGQNPYNQFNNQGANGQSFYNQNGFNQSSYGYSPSQPINSYANSVNAKNNAASIVSIITGIFTTLLNFICWIYCISYSSANDGNLTTSQAQTFGTSILIMGLVIIILGITAIITGALSNRKPARKTGSAIAGIVCGSIGIGLYVISFTTCILIGYSLL